MQFDSLAQFLDMGGHGAYVWAAYGVALVVLGWNALAPLLARRRLLAEESRRLQREEARQ